MQNKSVWGSLVGAFTIYSFYRVVRGIVAAFGDGQAAGDLVGIVTGWHVKWEEVYVFLFLFGALMLVGMYYPALRQAWKNFFYPPQPRWDETLVDAIYVATCTHYSDTLNDKNRVQLASRVVENALKDGRIRSAGRKPDGTFEAIPSKIWRDNVFQMHAPTRGHNVIIEWAVPANRKGEPYYEGVMINRNAIRKMWPEAPRSTHY